MTQKLSRRQVLRALSLSLAGSPWLLAQADEVLGSSAFGKTGIELKARIIETGEILDVDNDEIYQLILDKKAEPLSFFHPSGLSPRTSRFMTLEQVLSSITPEIETHFDSFICVNTSQQDSEPTNFLPAQSMTIIGRTHPDESIFERNSSDEIIGITRFAQNFQANFFNRYLDSTIEESLAYARRHSIKFSYRREQLPYILPISSGLSGSGSILTFSGAFQINLSKTIQHQQKSVSSPMSHAMYIAHQYGRGGRWSGVAIHGTPPNNWNKLGKTRASHGCLRTLPFAAKAIRRFFIESTSQMARHLPEFDSTSTLPKLTGKQHRDLRPKVIILLFQGYQRPTIHLG
ncbi:MAG: L,D-transpeptidase [Bdellovibrionales bacterium]|nr:L,D-transpeptidase [Bdellovibrionales bacterium]